METGQIKVEVQPTYRVNIVNPQPATSTPDWLQNDSTASDYIKNRPFYDGVPVKQEIIPESNVSFSKFANGLMFADFPENLLPIEGETYYVYWDGAEYACVCSLVEGNVACFGNKHIVDGGYDDTGEPFIFVGADGCIVYTSDNSTYEHLIGIAQFLPQIKQIDKKYIPDDAFAQRDWDEQDETSVCFIRNRPLYFGKETSITVEKTTKTINAGTNYLRYTGECSFNAGTSYRIFGKVYSAPFEPANIEDIADEIDMIVPCNRDGKLEINFIATRRIVGDSSPYGAVIFDTLYDSTDRTSYRGEFDISVTVGSGKEYILKIDLTVVAIKQVDSLLIPDSIQRVGGDVIIPSSTPDSTKKFKITVDDTGAISATEVTT